MCGVGDEEGLSMEAEDGEEKKGSFKAVDAERKGKEEDGRDMRKLIDPRRPTKEEVDEHDLTHLPYRNWCPICVKAKGKELDHRKSIDEPKGLSEYSFDYCFPGDELGHKLTVLVGKEKTTGMSFATTVPTKGASGKFAVDKAIEYMEEIGDHTSKVIVKTDQEPSIQFFVKDLIESRPEGQTIVEESPVKSSGSNGVVERAAQGIEGQLRIALLALERRMKRDIDSKEPIVTFMPEYAAYL